MKNIVKTGICLFMIFQITAVFAAEATDSKALLQDLQSSYGKLQKAISDQSLAGFIDAKKPHPDSSKITEADFKEQVSFIAQMYPPFKVKDFIKVMRKDNIAGYYYLGSDNSDSFVNVSIVKFLNVNGVWKVGDVGSDTKPVKSKTGVKDQIQKMIETSNTLKLKD